MKFDVEEQPHREMCGFLQRLVERLGAGSEQAKGMLLVPRGSFKSSLASIGLPIWLLVRDPNLRILISSHTHDIAKDYLQEIQAYLQYHQAVRDFVGDWVTGAPEWSEESILIPQRTKPIKEPSIDTAGVNRPKVGGHYDVIICDDLHSEKNITSDATIRSVHRYVQTLYPILEPGGVLLIIGTRWHNNDVYGHILRQDEAREKKFGKREWVTLIRSAYLPDGSLYFPSRLTEEFLRQKRDELEEKYYAVWYENSPIEESARIFPRRWWRFFDGEVDPYPFPVLTTEEASFPVALTMAVDPAYSTSAEADYTGITVVAVDGEKTWYVLEATRLKAGPATVLDTLVYYIRRYGLRRVAIEATSAQVLYRAALVDRLREEGLGGVAVIPYTESRRRTKAERINALQPLMRAGKIVLRRGLSDLYQELEDWPETRHDDLLDSLAQHMAIVAPPQEVWKKWVEEDDKEDDLTPASRKAYTLPTAGMSTAHIDAGRGR
jgi:predicted phage terminase large subunit-like protein